MASSCYFFALFIKKGDDMSTQLRAPIDVQIELTQTCNQRCAHCYNYWTADAGAFGRCHLSREKLREILERLAVNGVPSVTFTGGEPFVRRDILFYGLEKVGRLGMHASVNSNFSLVTEADIVELAYYRFPVLVSLLSADAQKHELLSGTPAGTHGKVLRNLEAASRNGLSFSLNMVLLPENRDGIREMAALAKKVGARVFCATKALPNFGSPDVRYVITSQEVTASLEDLIDAEAEFGQPVEILGCYPKCLLWGTRAYDRFAHRICVAGKTTLTVGVDGAARPCSHMEASFGNVLTEGLSTIWRRMRGLRCGGVLPRACLDCRILSSCTGGCRVNNLDGKTNAMDMHATPERVAAVVPQVSQRKIGKQDQAAIPGFVQVPGEVRFRQEDFGSVVYRTDRWSIILVNAKTAAFLKNRRGKGCFRYADYLDNSGAANNNQRSQVARLFRKLLDKGLLESLDKQTKEVC